MKRIVILVIGILILLLISGYGKKTEQSVSANENTMKLIDYKDARLPIRNMATATQRFSLFTDLF